MDLNIKCLIDDSCQAIVPQPYIGAGKYPGSPGYIGPKPRQGLDW